MKLVRIESPAELRRSAPAWDDLWWRSDSYLPTHRAELLAQWGEHFGARQFIALAIEDHGQLVAALPLVAARKAGMLPVGQLAANCWSDSSTLLVDRLAPLDKALPLLLDGLRKLPWPLLSLDGVPLADPAWAQLAAAAAAHHPPLPRVVRPQYHVGLIDINHDWDSYVAAWSSNHRTAVRKSLRKLEAEAAVELQMLQQFDAAQIQPLLHTAFEIEDKSWKGSSGTSILRTPGMFDFFLRQAQQLVEWGQLELLLLNVDGRPIAFEYCYVAKGVTASHKIGYDAEYSQFGPGRLLRYLQLQRYFADPQRRLFDTLGILCESKAKWCTRSYAVSRLMIGSGGAAGRAALASYEHFWPRLRALLRRGEAGYVPPKLGAAALSPAFVAPVETA